MNELSTIVDDDRMTSLQIAEITARLHKNVMRAIRNMEPAWEKSTGASLSWLITKMKKARQDLATLSTRKNASTSLPSSTMKREQS